MYTEVFKCERRKCNLSFTAKVDAQEAPICPKCKDSEYVDIVYAEGIDPRNPGFDDYDTNSD